MKKKKKEKRSSVGKLCCHGDAGQQGLPDFISTTATNKNKSLLLLLPLLLLVLLLLLLVLLYYDYCSYSRAVTWDRASSAMSAFLVTVRKLLPSCLFCALWECMEAEKLSRVFVRWVGAM